MAGCLLFGFGDLQLELSFLGAPGRRRQIDGDLTAIAIAPSGFVQLALPNNPALSGYSISSQTFLTGPGVNAAGFVTSDGQRLRLGVR